MAVYKQKNSANALYKFTWNGLPIRENTKQTNRRVAEQIELAHRTRLAKGEIGIRERNYVLILEPFGAMPEDGAQ
jgi:hypothetical protein